MKAEYTTDIRHLERSETLTTSNQELSIKYKDSSKTEIVCTDFIDNYINLLTGDQCLLDSYWLGLKEAKALRDWLDKCIQKEEEKQSE